MLFGIASVLCLGSIFGIGYTAWQVVTGTLTAVAPVATLMAAGASFILLAASLYH